MGLIECIQRIEELAKIMHDEHKQDVVIAFGSSDEDKTFIAATNQMIDHWLKYSKSVMKVVGKK